MHSKTLALVYKKEYIYVESFRKNPALLIFLKLLEKNLKIWTSGVDSKCCDIILSVDCRRGVYLPVKIEYCAVHFKTLGLGLHNLHYFLKYHVIYTRFVW